MTTIHPTAIVDPAANVGAGVTVGPFCLVGPDVTLADEVVLTSHVVVTGRTTIGARTKVYPFASLGHAPQDLKYRGEPSELRIGTDTVIREHVTMNTGTEGGGLLTAVGDRCLIMVGAHVAHDCLIGNNVILVNNATLGDTSGSPTTPSSAGSARCTSGCGSGRAPSSAACPASRTTSFPTAR